MHRILTAAATTLVLGLAVPAGIAQGVRPFPFQVAADRLVAEAASIEEISTMREVVLAGVPIGDGARVDLRLRRVDVADAKAAIFVDGAPTAQRLDAGISLWSGDVLGESGSDAFLALSPFGSRGWVRSGGELHHLLAEPGDGGDWSRSRSRFVTERALRDQGVSPNFECLAGALPSPSSRSVPAPPPAAAAAPPAAFLPIYRCEVAVETDFAFFALFGNLTAARTYAVSLMGAVSLRYREQVGVILTLPYLGLSTSVNDPWSGGDTFSQLDEFQITWSTNGPPVPADLYHFISGAPLGGGVAYLDVLCDQTFGFGVSADLAGLTPFPISLGPLNWDFFVVAHELGHNFGSIHTHEFCPPLDTCGGGNCGVPFACGVGTIMSYCHGCDGMNSIDPVFHPTCALVMRAEVESSCLPVFTGLASTQSVGHAKTGSGGTPELDVTFAAAPNRLRFEASSAPAQTAGVLILGDGTSIAPFLGGILVPSVQLFFGTPTGPTGDATLEIPTAFSVPNGVVIWAQVWFVDGPGFAATDGVEFELILP